ncbi:MAG: hypothetical protein M0Z99_12890 [Betaproteobacteria bacterium]|nr:hypothetical protein [Betaproteobacteria bacterium]
MPAPGSAAPGFWLPDATAAVARQYGALSDWMVVKVAKRYTFIIDPVGRIAKVYRSIDPARHSQEIVAELKALQGKATADKSR